MSVAFQFDEQLNIDLYKKAIDMGWKIYLAEDYYKLTKQCMKNKILYSNEFCVIDPNGNSYTVFGRYAALRFILKRISNLND